MVQVTFIKNPFNPDVNRVVKAYDEAGRPLRFYLSDFISCESVPVPVDAGADGTTPAPTTAPAVPTSAPTAPTAPIEPSTPTFTYKDCSAQLNGQIFDPITDLALDVTVPEGSYIIIIPIVGKGGGKGLFGFLASVLLSVVGFGVGGLVASGVWGSWAGASAFSAFAGYLTSAAVMFLGGSLISKMGPRVGRAKFDSENDPTYGWDGVQTMEGQGNALSITYGTVKSAGQSIVKFITNDKDKQYLNWLISAGEGPLEISDVKVNNNPIANYEGVTCETRAGLNTQDIISNFNDTIQTKQLGYEINDEQWRTDITDGNAAQGVIIEVECSNGLYWSNDDASLGTAWVQIRAECALDDDAVPDDKKGWKVIVEGTETSGRIEGAQLSAVRRQFRLDHLPQGRYKVRVKVTARSHSVTSTRAGVKIYWTGVSAVIYDDFMYPNVALVGIKALATNQLSGNAPTLTFIKTRKTVWVYNSNAKAYQEKPADNPAWAAYDFLHGCRKLDGAFDVRGVPAELMIYDQFEEWAANCDKLKLKINIEMAVAGDLWELVNKDIAPVGRGKIVRYGTRFGCYFDHSSQPVQLFGMGNIKAGSFQLQYLGTEDRANAVEITFTNADKDFERDTVTIYGDDYDNADIVQNPTQIQMNGITSYEQAFREGKYQLKCNQLLLKTVTFKADVDAIGCTVGDQILVAHDVPQWAYSGRVEAVRRDTVGEGEGAEERPAPGYTLTVYIDGDTRPEGVEQWAVQYRSSKTDKIYTLPCTWGGTEEWGRYTIWAAFDDADPPQGGDVFVLGKMEATSKPFIVTSITRTQDLERQISAIEYAEGVFEEDYTIPIPDYSLAEEPVAENVIKLTARQIAYTDAARTQRCLLFASWDIPEGKPWDYFLVYLSVANTNNFKLMLQTEYLSCEIETMPNTVYYIKVVTVYKLKHSSGTVYGPIAPGVDIPPPDVEVLDYDVGGYNDFRRFWWKFTYPYPNDIAGFEFRYTQGLYVNWENGIKMHTGVITEQPFETNAIRHGLHTVMIRAVDYAGQYSKGVCYASVNFGDPIEENVLFKVDLSDWKHGIVHNGEVIDGYLYSKQNSYFWSEEANYFWLTDLTPFWNERYDLFDFNFQIQIPASGQFWLEYEIDGPAKIEWRKTGDTPFWQNEEVDGFWRSGERYPFWLDELNLMKPYCGRVMVKAGDIIQLRIQSPANAGEATVLKKLVLYIDVPDREEHFENLTIPAEGLKLDIKTPFYYTTAVRIDVQGDETNLVGKVDFTRNPCVIKLFDLEKKPMSAVCDVTWQGFVNEVLQNEAGKR